MGFIGNIGATELIVVLVIVLVLFGSTKIPKLMRGFGEGVHEFKKGLKEGTKEEDKTPEQGSSTHDNHKS